jgi:hypothetical protein
MEALFDDDESHPIPFVGNLDTLVPTNVGVYVGLVIAFPLRADDRSLQRLAKKVEIYVDYLKRERVEWEQTHQQPMVGRFYVDIHHGSAKEIFDLMDHYQRYIESESIIFHLRTKNVGFGVQ